ncbi:MAG: DUF1887 family protein [Clostridia bacterium]|nr:DUF1887 family protein [Clostridia bacterium]
MKTLIELYDERPMENVLAAEMFRPESTVFICPSEVADSPAMKKSLERYFQSRGVDTRCVFVPVNMLNTREVVEALRGVLEKCEDCAIDIAGGTDSALFAAGMVAGGEDVPVFTYSHKRNTFYDIKNAPFADSVPCGISLTCADCFLMAGGSLRQGREDNSLLKDSLPEMDLLWKAYCRFKKEWHSAVTYMQRVSQGLDRELAAHGPTVVKGDRGQVSVNTDLMQMLEDGGLIHGLEIKDGEVSFAFRSPLVRFWLRDVGSALEVHVYRACVSSGLFNDVILSAAVNWHYGGKGDGNVTNEIDVMAVRGVKPIFISCKATEIRTEALNELAILRDRFGGAGSYAAIVTSANISSRNSAAMRARAQELNINVISAGEAKDGEKLVRRLAGIYGR